VWEVESLAPDVIVVASFWPDYSPKDLFLAFRKYGNSTFMVASAYVLSTEGLPRSLRAFRWKAVYRRDHHAYVSRTGYRSDSASSRRADSSGDNQASLEERLAEIGAGLLLETLDRLEAGTITPEAQDEARATYSPQLSGRIAGLIGRIARIP